jgi:hypothetical protein
MAVDRRERVIENLAVASALGFLALIIAAASLAFGARAAEDERAALAPAGASIVELGRADDPGFGRVYKIQSDNLVTYAALMSLRSPAGVALVRAQFSSKGELQELRFLGSCASRLPPAPRELVAQFPGADEAIARAAAFTRRLINRATEGQS